MQQGRIQTQNLTIALYSTSTAGTKSGEGDPAACRNTLSCIFLHSDV